MMLYLVASLSSALEARETPSMTSASAITEGMIPGRVIELLEGHRGFQEKQAPVALGRWICRRDQIRGPIDEVGLELPQPMVVDVEPHGRSKIALKRMEALGKFHFVATPSIIRIDVKH